MHAGRNKQEVPTRHANLQDPEPWSPSSHYSQVMSMLQAWQVCCAFLSSYARSSCKFKNVCTYKLTLLRMVKMSCVLQGLTSSSSTGSICPFVHSSHGPHVMMAVMQRDGHHLICIAEQVTSCCSTVCLRNHVYTLICRAHAQASAEHLVTRADVHASLGTPALSVQHTELEVLDLAIWSGVRRLMCQS
jgi:hypothetical protein